MTHLSAPDLIDGRTKTRRLSIGATAPASHEHAKTRTTLATCPTTCHSKERLFLMPDPQDPHHGNACIAVVENMRQGLFEPATRSPAAVLMRRITDCSKARPARHTRALTPIQESAAHPLTPLFDTLISTARQHGPSATIPVSDLYSHLFSSLTVSFINTSITLGFSLNLSQNVII